MNIYVQKDGQKQGPFSESEIRRRFVVGDFKPDDLALGTGQLSWKPLSSLIRLNTPLPDIVKDRKGQRICKTCGASYKTFTLFGLAKSKVCAGCAQKFRWNPYDGASRKHAVREVQNACALYLMVIVLYIILGFVVNPIFFGLTIIALVCDLAMWMMHSRAPAIILALILLVSIVLYVSIEGLTSKSGWYILFILPARFTSNASSAVFKLHRHFAITDKQN